MEVASRVLGVVALVVVVCDLGFGVVVGFLVFGVLVPYSNGGGHSVFQRLCWLGVFMFILDLDQLLILVLMDLVAG